MELRILANSGPATEGITAAAGAGFLKSSHSSELSPRRDSHLLEIWVVNPAGTSVRNQPELLSGVLWNHCPESPEYAFDLSGRMLQAGASNRIAV